MAQRNTNKMQKSATHNNMTLAYSERNRRWEDQRGHAYKNVTDTIAGWFPPPDRAPELVTANRRIHETGEAAILGTTPPHQPDSDQEQANFRAVWDAGTKLRESGNALLGTGLLVFFEPYYQFGVVDVAMKTPEGTVLLYDWQTEPLGVETGEPCRWPLDGYLATNATKHALKLAMLERLLRDGQYVPRATNVVCWSLYVDVGKVECVPFDPMPRESAEVLLAALTYIPF